MAREGVLFKNAFTSNPKAGPCRATILTGRNTWQLEEAVSHNGCFPDRWPVETTEIDADRVDPAPTFEVIKRLGGYYFDLCFGRRPADELYRLVDDPAGVRNLANDLAFAPIMERLRSLMMELLREEQDPRALGRGEIFDHYRYLERGQGDRPRTYDAWIRSREPALRKSLEAEVRAQPGGYAP